MGEMHNWWDAVKQLSAAHRFVDHQPETSRYARARQKLPYLIREGVYLGYSHRIPSDDRVEIAIWAPPADGKGPGYYCCFRLYLEDDMVIYASLFCFYDGTESSPSLRNLHEAEAYARANQFAKEADNENQN